MISKEGKIPIVTSPNHQTAKWRNERNAEVAPRFW